MGNLVKPEGKPKNRQSSQNKIFGVTPQRSEDN